MAGNRKVGLALAGLVLVFGIFIADPLLLVVIALPGSLLIQRVGGSSTNLSAADLLVFVAAVVSLFHIRWKEAPYLRQFMKGIVWFQAILILVVIAHPFRDNIVEWFHRWSYVGGSVLVGWVIATNGRTKQAFRLFLAGSSILALIAMEHAVTSHFQPAQWGVYQKNGIGAIMWIAIVVAQINPSWTGIGRTEARINKYLCIGGLLASQSRQSVILLILAIGLAAFLNPELRRKSKLLMLAAVPVAVALYFSFSIAARNNPQFNSVTARVDQISAAIHVWHLSPILGEGMRFYNLPQFITVTAPPNVLIDNLASTGIIGSLAFVFMVWVTVRTMFRLPVRPGHARSGHPGLPLRGRAVRHLLDRGLVDRARSSSPGSPWAWPTWTGWRRRAATRGPARWPSAPAATGRTGSSAELSSGRPRACHRPSAGWMSAVKTAAMAAGDPRRACGGRLGRERRSGRLSGPPGAGYSRPVEPGTLARR